MAPQSQAVASRGQTTLTSTLVGWWGVVLIMISIVWPRYGFLSLGPINVTPFTLLATLSWVGLPVVLLLDPALRAQLIRAILRRRFIILAIFVAYAWRVFTSITGVNIVESLTFLTRQIAYFFPVLFLSLIVCGGPNGRQRALLVIVVSTALVIAAATWELLAGQTISRLMGLDLAGDAQTLNAIVQTNTRAGGGAIRLQSVFSHPIVFGQYLAWAAPLMLYAATSRRPPVIRIVAAICFCAAPFFIFKTDARSGLLAFAAATGLYGALIVVRRTGLVSLPAALAATASLAVALLCLQAGQSTIGDLINGRTATEAGSTNARRAMFERGFQEIQSSPIIGFGDNMSPYYAGIHGRFGILTIDSAYLSALLDSGWVGLFLQLLAWLSALFVAVRVAMSRSGSGFDAAIAGGLVAVLLVFAALSIMDNITLIFIAVAMTTGIMPSTLSAPMSVQRSPRNPPVGA